MGNIIGFNRAGFAMGNGGVIKKFSDITEIDLIQICFHWYTFSKMTNGLTYLTFGCVF